MDSYIFCLISTYVPKHSEYLTFLAGGRLVKEERNGKTYANGVLHSFEDKPAEIWDNGTQVWYKKGKIDRNDDLPAVIHADGTQEWYKNGEPHRDGDLPAVISENGIQWWHNYGQFRRDGGLPAVISENGIQIQMWYKYGKRYLPI